MVTRARDNSTWRIGTDADVAWITAGTSGIMGPAITAAIPPVFEAYATVVLPPWGEGQADHDRAMLAPLREQSAGQPWWLGYLDTGADDIVFPGTPTVTLYWDWHYVLVKAGWEQAATWRRDGPGSFWKGALPNLVFPADRSWLVSTLWTTTGPASADQPRWWTGTCTTQDCRRIRWPPARTGHHQAGLLARS